MIGKIKGIKSGGLDINGIIKEYEARGIIDAGDFVRFLEEYNLENDTKLNSVDNKNFKASAVKLTDNKIFIAYDSDNTNHYLYGMICIVENNTITISINTQLNNMDGTGITISAVALDENRVFIAHSYDKSLYRLASTLCTINETTITIENDSVLSSNLNSGTRISAVKLSNNKIFIAHSNNDQGYHLYGIVCTINEATTTYGTDTQLTTTSAGYNISAIALNENKVFIANGGVNSDNYLYGMICSIGINNSIKKETNIQLSSTTNSAAGAQIVKLVEDKILIIHKSDTINDYLYGIVCRIEGTTIIKGIDTQLSDIKYSGYEFSIQTINKNKVFIAHDYNTNHYLYGMICIVNGDVITVEIDKQLSNVKYSAYRIYTTVLLQNQVFIGHGNNDVIFYFYGLIINILKLGISFVTKLTSKDNKILGVAQSNGNDGQLVKVVRPNYNESEEN